jgi:hypothetical protein
MYTTCAIVAMKYARFSRFEIPFLVTVDRRVLWAVPNSLFRTFLSEYAYSVFRPTELFKSMANSH